MPAVPSLQIDLLGGFRLKADGRALPRTPTARQQQLIAFLVLHGRGGAIPRQRVGGSLWPDSTDVQALTNLRRELHHLREDSPKLEALIDAGSRTLAWRDEAPVVVDVLAFDDAAERGLGGDRAALLQAAQLYQGDLLPDASGEWIDADRERLRQRAREVLARSVALLEQDRAFAEAIDHARQLLRLDPVDEPAWCALMRCYARRGERATALHLYQECAAVLKRELGIQPSAQTRLTYREILDLDEATPAVQPPRTAVYPLVGRQNEWRTLVGAWRAAAGHTRLFVIRGEAGIGKTRLAEEFVAWAHTNGVAALTARCYASEGRLAYAPIAAWLQSDALKPALMTLEAPFATDVARLRPELLAERPEVPAPARQLENWQRLPFFDALARAFRSAAPIALIVDDLQWADGDTIDWLQHFVHAASPAQCLVVGTVRAAEEQDNPPLRRLLASLERDNLMTSIALGPLDRTATAQLAGEVAEHPLDDTAAARTFKETEGHPLFIIERGRMDLAQQPDTTTRALPQVQSVVAARLALLSDNARGVAEVAAAVGRDFRFDILAEASDLEEAALVRALDELWQRHIVRVQADERWDFSHDRIREVAYSSIGPARQRLIHRRIAQGMERLFANHLDDVSAAIAVHLDHGGLPARAVPFLERAAAVALRVSATEEAIRCLTYALTLLERLSPGRDRDAQELALRAALSVPLNAARGYAAPDVETNLDRIFELERERSGGPVPVRWLWVAFTLRFMQGDLKRTRGVSEAALALSASDPSCRCEAHHAMGGTLLACGELEESRRHFIAALSAYDEEQPQHSALGSDLGVFGHAWSSHTHWALGDETAAVEHADAAVALAQRLDHMYSQTLAHAYAALLHQLRGDADLVVLHGNATIALCDRYGFAYYGDWARTLIGWAKGLERPEEGVALMESALQRLDAQRAQARRPYFLSLLADLYERLGNRERMQSIVNQAIAMSLERGDVWWLPALYLQRSTLEPAPASDRTRQEALDLARAQGNRALEQRISGLFLRTVSRTV